MTLDLKEGRKLPWCRHLPHGVCHTYAGAFQYLILTPGVFHTFQMEKQAQTGSLAGPVSHSRAEV